MADDLDLTAAFSGMCHGGRDAVVRTYGCASAVRASHYSFPSRFSFLFFQRNINLCAPLFHRTAAPSTSRTPPPRGRAADAQGMLSALLCSLLHNPLVAVAVGPLREEVCRQPVPPTVAAVLSRAPAPDGRQGATRHSVERGGSGFVRVSGTRGASGEGPLLLFVPLHAVVITPLFHFPFIYRSLIECPVSFTHKPAE